MIMLLTIYKISQIFQFSIIDPASNCYSFCLKKQIRYLLRKWNHFRKTISKSNKFLL